MTCLITGCLLYNEATEKAVWGDLHGIGSCYIFNACLDEKGEAAWAPYPGIWDAEARPSICIQSPPPDRYFERRGVINVHMGWCCENDEATRRLK